MFCLAVLRGKIKNEQLKFKRGMVGRIFLMVATGAACFGYITAKFLFQMPWWFTHLGHAIVAVLMFCTFTYPWTKFQNKTHDQILSTPPKLTA
jgi:hypothetical protein